MKRLIAVVVILGVVGFGLLVRAEEKAPEIPEWQKAIEKKMEQKISFDFKNTPFTDVIRNLQTKTGITFMIGPQAFEGSGGEIPNLTLQAKDMKTETAVKWITRMANLIYKIKDECVYIDKEILGDPVTVVYDVRDLIAPMTHFLAPSKRFGEKNEYPPFGQEAPDDDVPNLESIEGIIRSIGPEGTWGENNIRANAGTLIITQRPEIHELIKDVLEKIRKNRSDEISYNVQSIAIERSLVENILSNLGKSNNRLSVEDTKYLERLVAKNSANVLDAIMFKGYNTLRSYIVSNEFQQERTQTSKKLKKGEQEKDKDKSKAKEVPKEKEQPAAIYRAGQTKGIDFTGVLGSDRENIYVEMRHMCSTKMLSSGQYITESGRCTTFVAPRGATMAFAHSYAIGEKKTDKVILQLITCNWEKLPADSDEQPAPKPEWQIEIEKKLQQPMTFNFEGTPFTDVVRELQNKLGITIMIPPDTFESSGGEIPNINLAVNNMKAKTVLLWVAKMSGCRMIIKDGIIVLPKLGYEEDPVTKVYDVRDLVALLTHFLAPEITNGEIGGGQEAPDDNTPDLNGIQGIIRTLGPEGTWGESNIQVCAGSLIITQRPGIHALIKDALSKIREKGACNISYRARVIAVDNSLREKIWANLVKNNNILSSADLALIEEELTKGKGAREIASEMFSSLNTQRAYGLSATKELLKEGLPAQVFNAFVFDAKGTLAGDRKSVDVELRTSLTRRTDENSGEEAWNSAAHWRTTLSLKRGETVALCATPTDKIQGKEFIFLLLSANWTDAPKKNK